MPDVKGVQIRAVIQFLKVRFGDEAVTASMAVLSPEDRALLPAVILDSNWYSYTVWRPVSKMTRTLTPETSGELSVEMGKYLAQYAFTGVYKSLLISDPIKMLEKIYWIHEFFSRDTSKIETQILSKSSGLLRYRYEKGVLLTRASCLTIVGLWVRALELSGATGVKCDHRTCITDGASTCDFLFEWQ